jgi:DNA polymerase-3 subunit delta'
MLLNEIVGHSKQVGIIRKLVEKDLFPQVSLFVGPEGVGKRTIALEVLKFLAKNPLNVQVFGLENPLTIKEVREFSEWLFTKPSQGEKKAVLIDRADEIKKEAANALLKILEEPPDYAFFCLITKNENSVLPTIRSRCKIFRFGPLSESNVSYVLEKLGVTPNEKILKISRGSVGMALKLHDSQVPSLLEELSKLIKNPKRVELVVPFAEKFSNLPREETLLFLDALEALVYEKGNLKWEEAISKARYFLKFYGKPQSVVEWLLLEVFEV